MRRSDREITDPERIQKIIDGCHCCRIGINDNGTVYIVPMNFGYEKDEGKYILYFHSAKEGRKIDLLQASPQVGFEMDTGYRLNRASIACACSASFQSVIGTGVIRIVNDYEEKKKALLAIMRHNTGESHWEFHDEMLDAVCIFRLAVHALTCKEHL